MNTKPRKVKSCWTTIVNRSGAKSTLTASQEARQVRQDARNSKRDKKPRGAAR